MIIGKVIGNIYSTIHHPFCDGKRMLVVEKIDTDGQAQSGYLVAVDHAGAGLGETVLVLDEGTGARQARRCRGMEICHDRYIPSCS